MRSRVIWIGAGLSVLVLVAAFAVLRAPGPEADEGISAAAQKPTNASREETRPPAKEGNASFAGADLKALPPEIRAQVETALKDAGAKDVRIASLNPQAKRGRNNLEFLFTPPAMDAPAGHREAWDKYMAPLMYPPGHPRAGQWRDNVSPADVEHAAMPLAEKFYPPDYLDQPMLHVPQKRINFDELNMAASRLWNRQDPATAPGFYEWLKNAPEDPGAPAGDYWLPAPPGHPEATTQRRAISEEIVSQVAEQLEEQRAAARASP